MNVIPCDLVNGSEGVMGAFGLIGFPFGAAGELLHVFSQWPGQGLWLIGGFLLPWRARTSILFAAALAVLGFFGYWLYFALNNYGRTNVPDSCSLLNEDLFTFLTALVAFLAGQALRRAWKNRRPAAPPAKA
ncbi:MAG: hypothetical protein ACHQ2Z_08930 [Elusimicrobiota bacterium]